MIDKVRYIGTVKLMSYIGFDMLSRYSCYSVDTYAIYSKHPPSKTKKTHEKEKDKRHHKKKKKRRSSRSPSTDNSFKSDLKSKVVKIESSIQSVVDAKIAERISGTALLNK